MLSYRAGGGRPAAEDLAAAIDYVFTNVDTLDVDTDEYSLWGSSAGARMAAGIDTEFHVYLGVGHGFGLGTGAVVEGWVDEATAFWDAHRP